MGKNCFLLLLHLLHCFYGVLDSSAVPACTWAVQEPALSRSRAAWFGTVHCSEQFCCNVARQLDAAAAAEFRGLVSTVCSS